MRDCRAQAKVTRLFPGIVFDHFTRGSSDRHSTSVQPFYLCCRSGWVDVPDCGRNCQLAVGDDGPVPCPLAFIVGHLLGNNVAGISRVMSSTAIGILAAVRRRDGKHQGRSGDCLVAIFIV
jgi:hypothetical protein